MQFQGRLICKEVFQPSPELCYTKVFIAQEIGHGLEIAKVLIFDSKPLQQLENIAVGTDICVNVFKSSGTFKATSISPINLYPCPQCLKPLDNTQKCDGCDNEKQERIEGVWIVKSAKPLSPEQSDCIRIVLRQEDNNLGFVAFPFTPFYEILANLNELGQVCLMGWRNSQRYTKLSNVSCQPPSSLSIAVQCMECGKDFKNKNSLNTHKYQYHRQSE